MSSLEQPLVSVVIPCYNHEKFVMDCIQSVIDQTYQNIELIIIDDGSKDGSVDKIQEMLEKCQHRFTHFEFRYRPNRGLSATLNEALEWCKGDYFSAIASDDSILKNKIEEQINFYQKNQDLSIVGVFGGVNFIDDENKIININIQKKVKKINFEEVFFHDYYLLAPTQLLKTQAIKDVGCYVNGVVIEDWYMWLKLLEKGDFYEIPLILSNYRMHSSNTIKNLEKMHSGRFEVLSFFKNHEFYQKAYKNVLFLNAFEELKYRKDNRLKVIFNIIKKLKIYFFLRVFLKLGKRFF